MAPPKIEVEMPARSSWSMDSEKDNLRTDSSTAQFPELRVVLSLATIVRFSLSTIDISGAYLQEGELNSDIYMKPPRGWEAYPGELWKLEKPAYGLVDSGRLWHLCIEDWLISYGFLQLPGLPQFFYLTDNEGKVHLILAKVVDAHLIAGTPEQTMRFHKAFSKRFEIGRFVTKTPLTFNRLHITQDADFSVSAFMAECFEKIEII